MPESKRRPDVILMLFVILPWMQLMRSPGLAELRAVDTLLLMASGMALGALVARAFRRSRVLGR